MSNYTELVTRVITQTAAQNGQNALGAEVLRNLGLTPAPQSEEAQLHERLAHELRRANIPAHIVEQVLRQTDPNSVQEAPAAPQSVLLTGTVTFEVEVVVDGVSTIDEALAKLQASADDVAIDADLDSIEVLNSRVSGADLH